MARKKLVRVVDLDKAITRLASVKSIDPELIFIKPLINFQKDSMKIRFILKEESEKEINNEPLMLCHA